MTFQKGQVSNPNGRPKQSKRIEGGIISALSEKYNGFENGARAIGYELVRIASDREHQDQLKALKEISDRLDGKPAQAIIGGSGEDPPILSKITINVVKPEN